MSLKEVLFEPMQNASHSIRIFFGVFRSNSVSPSADAERKAIMAVKKEHMAWEALSAEALENFEKQFAD